MIRNKLIYRIVFLLWIAFLASNVNAQVRIGGKETPVAGATLDLNTTEPGGFKGALTPPVFALADTTKIPTLFTERKGDDTALDLSGLLIYNTTNNTANDLTEGLYYWDGYKWNSFGCLGLPESDEFVTDIEGNSYKTKMYGGKLWITEDLYVKKDNTGADLVDGTDYYEIDNNVLIYTKEAAQRICPTGWRLPTLADWQARYGDVDKSNLHTDLGDVNNAEDMLASFNITLPPGNYYFSLWWYNEALDSDGFMVISNYLYGNNVNIQNFWPSPAFQSVRCIKE